MFTYEQFTIFLKLCSVPKARVTDTRLKISQREKLNTEKNHDCFIVPFP